MPIKILPLFFVLALGWCQPTHAQLFPVGTKLHVVHMVSMIETSYQEYLTTKLDTVSGRGHLYTQIEYPGWFPFNYSYTLRLDSNKLYLPGWDNELLLFDFNAKVNDTLTIYQYYYHSTIPQDGENLGLAHIKIDSFTYDYYFNESHQRDSLKTIWYSGVLSSLPWPMGLPDPNLPKPFRYVITEKIIKQYTASGGSFLGVNIGYRTLSTDHTRLRCIEYPDGKSIHMEWWNQMAGNTIPCDFTFNIGTAEQQARPSIQLFPNPTSLQFTIENYSGNLSIYNQLGQCLQSQFVTDKTQVDIQSLPAGPYTVVLENKSRLPLAIIR